MNMTHNRLWCLNGQKAKIYIQTIKDVALSFSRAVTSLCNILHSKRNIKYLRSLSSLRGCIHRDRKPIPLAHMECLKSWVVASIGLSCVKQPSWIMWLHVPFRTASKVIRCLIFFESCWIPLFGFEMYAHCFGEDIPVSAFHYRETLLSP